MWRRDAKIFVAGAIGLVTRTEPSGKRVGVDRSVGAVAIDAAVPAAIVSIAIELRPSTPTARTETAPP